MSSPYRKVLDRRLADLDGMRRMYFDRVVAGITDETAFDCRENVAFMTLMNSVGSVSIELPVPTFMAQLLAFLDERNHWLRARIYDRSFVFNPEPLLEELSTGFCARIAETVLEEVKEGRIEPDEARPFSFNWPHYKAEEFPYWDDEDDVEEEENWG